MSIASTDLLLYSVASIPTDDVSTSGGAIDKTRRPAFTQFSSSAKLSLTSDGADTRTVTVVGRLGSGVIATETPALNGTTEVLTTNTFERIESVNIASSSGTRTVTCKQGSGGSTIATVPINEVGFHMSFQKAASSTGSLNRYEKIFWLNNHGSLALLGANVTLTADPAARIMIGVTTAVNGTTSVANRLTAPGGITFVDDNVSQNVPGTDLAAGDAVGVWVEQSLAANDTAQRNTYTTQLAGSST